MKRAVRAALFWLLLPATGRARDRSLRARRLEQPPPGNPVSKVVELLKGMKASLEKETDADEELYEKLACWCETNDKSKTKAIADAEKLLSDLGATIEKMSALSASLTVDIDGLEKEIAQNKKSLDVATALRQKQAAEFHEEEKELIESIRALGAATVVLSKHHEGGAALVSSVMSTVAAAANKHAALLQGVITPRQKRILASLSQGEKGADYFDSTPTFKQAYQPQSAEIFGILKQMKETFETNLSQSQKDELDAQQTYDALKTAKETEIAAGQASLQEKKEELAAADEKLVQSKSAKEDTEASLGADKNFLMDLKLKCSMTDSEWEERQKLRQAELAAISQAIGILSNDDARDLFHKTLMPASFIQVGRAGYSRQVSRAAEALEAAGAKAHNPKLVALATAVRLDPFIKVKKAIDDMVVGLQQEKEDEVKQRDWCIEELAKNERSTATQEHTKGSLETKIEALETTLSNLKATIETLNAEVADLEASKGKAKEDREAEAADFQFLIADQKKTQTLLQEAIDVLESVYAAQQEGSTGLLQQEPPPSFKAYEKRGEAPGVLALLTHIIEGAKAMEAEAYKDETAAQDEYTKFKQTCVEAIAAKQASIVDRKSELAQMEKDLLQDKSELDGTITELETLSNNLAGLHASCDYLVKNFDERQEARDQEVDALRQAKAFLSGMQPGQP